MWNSSPVTGWQHGGLSVVSYLSCLCFKASHRLSFLTSYKRHKSARRHCKIYLSQSRQPLQHVSAHATVTFFFRRSPTPELNLAVDWVSTAAYSWMGCSLTYSSILNLKPTASQLCCIYCMWAADVSVLHLCRRGRWCLGIWSDVGY